MLTEGTKVRIANDPVQEGGTIIGYATYQRSGDPLVEGKHKAYIVELNKGGYLSYDDGGKRNVFVTLLVVHKDNIIEDK